MDSTEEVLAADDIISHYEFWQLVSKYTGRADVQYLRGKYARMMHDLRPEFVVLGQVEEPERDSRGRRIYSHVCPTRQLAVALASFHCTYGRRRRMDRYERADYFIAFYAGEAWTIELLFNEEALALTPHRGTRRVVVEHTGEVTVGQFGQGSAKTRERLSA